MAFPILKIIWLMVAGVLTLWLPGAAILSFFPCGDRDLAEQLGRAMGLSMAVIIVGGLLTFLLSIHLSAWGIIVIYFFFLALGMLAWLRRPAHKSFSLSALLEGLALLLVGSGLIAWRWYQARSLILPAWVDPIQHVLIIQAILKEGGITGNLLPYLSVPLYYHFGFHAAAAVFTFWSHLSTDQAVLWFGQILEAGMSLAIYRLACVIWKHRGCRIARLNGIAAALLVGLVTHMPGYYLTWGRYTLLAGLILLALAMAEGIEAAQSYRLKLSWGDHYLVFPLMVAGVLLTHYLVAIFLAFFLLILVIPFLWEDLRLKHWRREQSLPLIGGTVIGTVLVSPWLAWVAWHAWSSFSLKMVLPAQSGGSDYVSYLLYLAGPQRNYFVLGVAGLGLFLALSDAKTREFGLWSLIFALLCLPVGVRLGPLRPDIVVMMIFFPEVLLAGHLIVTGGEAFGKVMQKRWAEAAAITLTLGVLCLWGIHETGDIINPVTVIADQADLQAINWIDQNLPQDAYFYLNTYPWQGTTSRGADGGSWILPLTGRQTLLPPITYAYGSPDYVAKINAWAAQTSQLTTCSADFWQVVTSSGVNYIYIHEGEGSLQPAGLANCDGIVQVYSRNGVEIYKIH